MVLQPTRRTAEEYCYPRGGLLPRLLTLTLAGGYFLLRYYTLTHIKPLTCTVLSVARTFLPHPKVAAMERTSAAKIQQFNADDKFLFPRVEFYKNRVLVRRVPSATSAKMPPIGSTWCTSHWWHFMLGAASDPLSQEIQEKLTLPPQTPHPRAAAGWHPAEHRH